MTEDTDAPLPAAIDPTPAQAIVAEMATPYGPVPMPAGADPESEHWADYYKSQLAIIRPLWVRGQREGFPLQTWAEWMKTQETDGTA